MAGMKKTSKTVDPLWIHWHKQYTNTMRWLMPPSLVQFCNLDSKHLPHCNHALTLYNLQQKLKNRNEGLEYLPLRSWDWWTTPVAEALTDQSPRLLHTHQSQKIWSMHHIPYFQNIFDFSWASHNKYITCKDRTFPHLLSSIHLTLTVVRPRHAWEFKEITRLSWSARDVLTGKFRAGKLP